MKDIQKQQHQKMYRGGKVRALITGVNGFVGGYLSEYLINKGVEVWGTKLSHEQKSKYLNEKVILRDLDITEKHQVYDIINDCKPDYIFHLAAQSSVGLSWEKPAMTIEVNVNGTLNLIEAVKEIKSSARILLIGSSEEYGIIKPEDVPINESCLLKPANPYAVSKMAQEELAKQYVSAYGMNIVIVRAFNHIGPGQNTSFVVSDFSKRIVDIEKGIIKPVLYVGNLKAKRDFTDVRDIVRGYYMLMKCGKNGEVYNIGSGHTYEISGILKKLLSMSNAQIEVKGDPQRMRPSDVPIIQCDNSKLKNLINWETTYSIDKTLADIMDYWRNN